MELCHCLIREVYYTFDLFSQSKYNTHHAPKRCITNFDWCNSDHETCPNSSTGETKGECSTGVREVERQEISTSPTAQQQETINRESWMEKENHTPGDGAQSSSALLSAPVAQAVTPTDNDVQATSPQTMSGTLAQEPDEVNKIAASGDLSPSPPAVELTHQPYRANTSFLPDDINFPKLQTPMRHACNPSSDRREGPISPAFQLQTPQSKERSPTPAFVWGPKPVQDKEPRAGEPQSDKGKAKFKTSASKVVDSAPITRQGYRTGCLAEDFWTALGIPNLPSSTRKTLQVIPFLIKNPLSEQAEYLVDHKTSIHGAIAQVHIAELLAGIPWTPLRAQNHVVNEISHALSKILIFNNHISNPFQNWQQGTWFAKWGEDAEGENTCTMFVCVAVTEQKVKPRKGQNFRWQQVPKEIRAHLLAHTEDSIAPTFDHQHWLCMAGKTSHKPAQGQHNPASSNVEDHTSAADFTADDHAK